MAFIPAYLIAYHFRVQPLRFFKIDVTFLLMVVLIVIASLIAVFTYEGANSIYGIVIMFFGFVCSVYLRYKNGVVSLLYSILDFNLGNYFVVALDLINLIISAITAVKNRKEKIVGSEDLKEYIDLIKVTREARRIKKQNSVCGKTNE